MAPQKNFHRYRLELEKRAPPLIPYMGTHLLSPWHFIFSDGGHVLESLHSPPPAAMYLRDITFIYDGNTDHLDENKTLINFEKFELVAALLSEIEKYQGTSYDMYAFRSLS
jgi:hypothetical protein